MTVSTRIRRMRLDDHKLVREEKLMEQMKNGYMKEENGGKTNNSSYKQLQNSGYLSQQSTKDWYKEIATRSFGKKPVRKNGRGTFFETVEELNEWLYDYFKFTNEHEVIPTVAGLACWLQCSPDIIRLHARNPNSEFHDSCEQALAICHSVLESGATESKLNSVAYIFQAKNYFNMKDQQDINVSASQGSEQMNSIETLNALKEQKEAERLADTPKIDMKEANYVEIEKADSLISKL